MSSIAPDLIMEAAAEILIDRESQGIQTTEEDAVTLVRHLKAAANEAVKPTPCPGVGPIAYNFAPDCCCEAVSPAPAPVPSRKQVAQTRADLFNSFFPPGSTVHVRSAETDPLFCSTVTGPCHIVQCGTIWHCVVQLDGGRHVTIEMTDANI